MANKPVKKNLSAEKRVRQSRKAREYNQAIISSVKTHTKKFNEALQAGDRDRVEAAFNDAVKVLNKASSKGVLKKNNASRRIGTISKKLHAFTSGPAAS